MRNFKHSRREVMIGLAVLSAPATLINAGPAQAVNSPLRAQIIGGDKRPMVHAEGSKFGCYDPYGDFSAQANVSTEHLFLPWEEVDLSSQPADDAYA